ncbi:MAG: YkgJ family cysteine cluster protein [Candidatus Gastranaerophilales bacterium]|nr:YkgJ family cysteine cluster protein [Candidatus Gastranaerophilales bacterium]
MDSLKQDYVKKRKIYRDIFFKSEDSIKKVLLALKVKHFCTNCKDVCEFKQAENLLFAKLPPECSYKEWQKEALSKLKNEISRDIYVRLQQILAYREDFHCEKCALCCNFACSEFSPSELKQKADNGDKFATQFLSVFIPYENIDEAKKIYPEYVSLLEAKYGDTESVYFYHCPKLSENNLCNDYENRPDVCRDFPNNPLAILPDSCGFKPWKDEIEVIALSLHALLEIVEYYIEKIEKAFL